MAREVATTEKQAELLKDQGNLYFKKERLSAAIEAYTEAITLCPDVPVFWTNRALCHRKRNDWERVEADCRRALELDNNSVKPTEDHCNGKLRAIYPASLTVQGMVMLVSKAHYMLGLALLQSKEYGQAVKQLEKALELGRGGKPGNYMVEEIWQELAKARYTEWEQGATVRQRQQRELKVFLERLLRQEYEKRVREVKHAAATARQEQRQGADSVIYIDENEEIGSAASEAASKTSMQSQAYVSADQRRVDELSKLSESHQERFQTLSEVFDKASAPDRPAEIPDHLCCKITMDIFRDPVITPSGVTYERAALYEHLRKVGKFDPLTRATLYPEQVVPNLALKEAVQSFLFDNGWAYKAS